MNKIGTLRSQTNNITNFFVILTTSFAAYKIYSHYDTLETRLRKIETGNELIKSKMSKTNHQVIELSDAMIQHLSKIDTSLKSLDPELILTKHNSLLLKMLEKQNTPIINIVSDNSYSKLITISLFFLVIGGTILTLYYYVPAVAIFTKKKIMALTFLSNNIITKIPGSNSADGVCYLPTYNLQLLTQIKSGHSTHTVIDLLTPKEYTLAEYLTKLALLTTQVTTKVVEQTPYIVHGLDITSIL